MEYLYIGKIVNTHGIKGELRLLSNFKYKEKVFVKYFNIYIGRDRKKEEILTYRHHKQFDMITLNGYNDINEVLKYKGSFVYIKREDLKLEQGEYLDEDLINFDVYVDDKKVGKVVDVRKDHYQDKIVVNKEEKEYLVPKVYGIIKNINLEKKIIVLENIKGLLE